VGQGRVPGGWLGRAGELHVVGVLADGFLVVDRGQAPRGRVVALDDGVGDRDARPIEVAVIAQLPAVGRDRADEAVEGSGRLAFGADERP
jgi:hypothetical protein